MWWWIVVGVAALMVMKQVKFDGTITLDGDFIDMTPVVSNAIQRFAQAIAVAEGFRVPGSIPQRAHNPGNLKVPGSTRTINGITVFDSDEQGWHALYRQLQRVIDGRSIYYTLSMSLEEMADTWTATEKDAWASNVARSLGTAVSTTLRELLT